MPPWVPNYGRRGKGPRIVPGMSLAIEPIVFDGKYTVEEKGKWLIVSKTGALSAHVEDTVFITEEGPLILTR